MRHATTLLLLLLALLATAQPAAAKTPVAPDEEEDYAGPADDPWSGFNRPVFSFNLAFDRHIAKPFISAYDEIPSGVRRSVSNVITNLTEPLNTVHGVLQGSPKIAFTSFWRFLLNTTFGLGGIRDFAREEGGLTNMNQNLGITMGRWGVGAGPYLVLPIYGPSSARDAAGRVGDWFLDPLSWAMTVPEAIGEKAADGIDTRDRQQRIVEHLYYESIDPYSATKSAYQQHELFKAKTQE